MGRPYNKGLTIMKTSTKRKATTPVARKADDTPKPQSVPGLPQVGDNQPGRMAVPVIVWQTLRNCVAIRKDDKLAPMKLIHDAGSDDAARVAAIMTWPSTDAVTARPSKRKKGKDTEVSALDTYFDGQTPYGVELASAAAVINAHKVKTDAQKDEIKDIGQDRRNAINIMAKARDICQRYVECEAAGFEVQFISNGKLTYKPIMLFEPKPEGKAYAVSVTLSIPDFLNLYPQGAKARTWAALAAAERPAEQGPDGTRNDTKVVLKTLDAVSDALTGVEGYLANDGRMKLVNAVGIKSQHYAHMRTTLFLLLDGIAPQAGDKKGDVYAAAAMLKELLPAPAAVMPETIKPETLGIPAKAA